MLLNACAKFNHVDQSRKYQYLHPSLLILSLPISALNSLLAVSFATFNLATGHICNDRSMFLTYQPIDPSQSSIAKILSIPITNKDCPGTMLFTMSEDKKTEILAQKRGFNIMNYQGVKMTAG
jgi:hypothetical protein